MSDIGYINLKHMVSYECFMLHYLKSFLRVVFVQITSKKDRKKRWFEAMKTRISREHIDLNAEDLPFNH